MPAAAAGAAEAALRATVARRLKEVLVFDRASVDELRLVVTKDGQTESIN
jgi:hypothetical protein